MAGEQTAELTFEHFVDEILADAQFASNLENALGNPVNIESELQSKFPDADPAQIANITRALQSFASYDPRIANLYREFGGDTPGICG